jgi:hypothetical protein
MELTSMYIFRPQIRPDTILARYRNRKGHLTQNVLAVCNFDMKFTNEGNHMEPSLVLYLE